jgi:hypothetical protein
VQCDTAPFIWSWGAADGVDYNVGDWPGTNQFKDTWTDEETGDVFWEWTFPEGVYPISFLFNNGGVDAEGNPIAVKQTADINSVTTDRYFILSWDDGDGNVSLVDITEEYIELPDAQVTKVSLAGNHNGWSGDTQWFDVIEAGKIFQLAINTAEYSIPENLWEFKFRPNAQEWCGYWDVVNQEELPTWLGEKGGNFLIDLEEGITETEFTFTAIWGGGKEAGKNWTFTATAGSAGINTLKTVLNSSNAAIYNLQGQRVNDNFRGIAIQNGRKMIVK